MGGLVRQLDDLVPLTGEGVVGAGAGPVRPDEAGARGRRPGRPAREAGDRSKYTTIAGRNVLIGGHDVDRFSGSKLVVS